MASTLANTRSTMVPTTVPITTYASASPQFARNINAVLSLFSLANIRAQNGQREKAKTVVYTARQRAHESGSKRRQAELLAAKPQALCVAENNLAQHDSRATTVVGAQAYVTARLKANRAATPEYTKLARVHRLLNLGGRQRSEDNAVKRMKATFGPNAILAIGIWREKQQMRGLQPSPTGGIVRLLSRHFTVLLVCEHYTTKKCARCRQVMTEDARRPRRPRTDAEEVRRHSLSFFFCTFWNRNEISCWSWHSISHSFTQSVTQFYLLIHSSLTHSLTHSLP